MTAQNSSCQQLLLFDFGAAASVGHVYLSTPKVRHWLQLPERILYKTNGNWREEKNHSIRKCMLDHDGLHSSISLLYSSFSLIFDRLFTACLPSFFGNRMNKYIQLAVQIVLLILLHLLRLALTQRQTWHKNWWSASVMASEQPWSQQMWASALDLYNSKGHLIQLFNRCRETIINAWNNNHLNP